MNDAIRDAEEAGLRRRDALRIVRILGRDIDRPTGRWLTRWLVALRCWLIGQ